MTVLETGTNCKKSRAKICQQDTAMRLPQV